MAESPEIQSNATWNDLPVESRVEVAKFLDKESQLSLRQCSKTDRNAVDKLPISLIYLKVSQQPKEFMTISKLLFTKKELRNAQERIGSRALGFDEAISQFQSIFKCKNSTVMSLEIGQFGLSRDQEQRRLIEQLLKQVLREVKIRKEKNYKIAWKIKCLKWNLDIKTQQLPDLLNNFSVDSINTMFITGRFKSRKVSQKLVELEQWKKLKVLFIMTFINCDGALNYFYHFEKVFLNVKHIQAEELANFIKNFRFKNTTPDVSIWFHFRVRTQLGENFLQEVSSYFDSTIQNEEHEIAVIHDRTYLKLMIPNDEDNVFAVGIVGNELVGTICASSNILPNLMTVITSVLMTTIHLAF